jgi:hypothetical protein
MPAKRRLGLLLGALSLGVLGAALCAAAGFFVPWRGDWLFPGPTPRAWPLPHHVPKHPGGISLRFAMVHDVLHERYPRHGRAYHAARNKRTLRELAKKEGWQPFGQRDANYLALLDDLGAGLDQLGQHEEAVRVLRDKLRQQKVQGLGGRNLYTTYANLGTFLIHGSARAAGEGDELARRRLEEGLSFVRRSIEVNPQAHFGREEWQATAARFLLAALDHPRVLLEADLVGNRLDVEIDPSNRDCCNRDRWGRAAEGAAHDLQREEAAENPEPLAPERRAALRKSITRVAKDVPFDEPVLGIVGMWRLGGGANPHFALALGETMLRVGQRYIAWCAYERAVKLGGFSPDPDARAELIRHCRARQALIEKQLPEEERARLRPRFEAELAHGLRFQKAYQDYEAKKIEEGADPEDARFYDAFFEGRGPIATPPGPEDQLVMTLKGGWEVNWPAVFLCGALSALAGALLVRFVFPAWRGGKRASGGA